MHLPVLRREVTAVRKPGGPARGLRSDLQVQSRGGDVRFPVDPAPWRGNPAKHAVVAELKSGKKTFTADADNMRTHIARISAGLYPRKYKEGQQDIILSAYVFRHALVTDLRGERWTVEEIAAVLGESSAETANWYGPSSAARFEGC